MAKKRKQAYIQAPWRRQLRSIGLSLLPIIAIAVVSALNLIISAQSAEAGLLIMDMHYKEEEILRRIANQRTELAWTTSYKEMLRRAIKAGFEKIPQESQHYMIISGYQGQETALIASPPVSEKQRAPIVNEFYQLSLWEWFMDSFLIPRQTNLGVNP